MCLSLGTPVLAWLVKLTWVFVHQILNALGTGQRRSSRKTDIDVIDDLSFPKHVVWSWVFRAAVFFTSHFSQALGLCLFSCSLVLFGWDKSRPLMELPSCWSPIKSKPKLKLMGHQMFTWQRMDGFNVNYWHRMLQGRYWPGFFTVSGSCLNFLA